MKRDLGDGYELDDDKTRIDPRAVHGYLAGESYWAKGRPYEQQERLILDASHVVGLYHDGAQVGFCRAVSDGFEFAYLADVYVLEEHRGKGLGEALVREMVDSGPWPDGKWLLHTSDMHPLYRKLGFAEPDYKVMERRPTSQESASG
jgi:GNAT superfamily N-acetyltransferase